MIRSSFVLNNLLSALCKVWEIWGVIRPRMQNGWLKKLLIFLLSSSSEILSFSIRQYVTHWATPASRKSWNSNACFALYGCEKKIHPKRTKSSLLFFPSPLSLLFFRYCHQVSIPNDVPLPLYIFLAHSEQTWVFRLFFTRSIGSNVCWILLFFDFLVIVMVDEIVPSPYFSKWVELGSCIV